MKVWLQKSVCNGYIVEVHDNDGNVTFARFFEKMWDAIDYFRN